MTQEEIAVLAAAIDACETNLFKPFGTHFDDYYVEESIEAAKTILLKYHKA